MQESEEETKTVKFAQKRHEQFQRAETVFDCGGYDMVGGI